MMTIQIHQIIETPLLIVGSGIAGLSCAVEAQKQNIPHVLISKTPLAGGASFFPLKATLGIQVTGQSSDKVLFQQDIERVAQGMNNPKIVKAYIEESAEAVRLLNEIGFQAWQRDDNRPACFAQYPRPIYLINNWKSAVKKAKEILNQQPQTQYFEQATLLHIVSLHNQVQGAVFALKHEEHCHYVFCQTPNIILATGGIAGLYQDNLYPADIIGSTHFLALKAGANLVNLEYIQFIPAFVAPKYKVLFGEHTLKYCIDVQDKAGNSLFPDLSAEVFSDMVKARSDYAPFSVDFDCVKFDLRIMQYLLQHPEEKGVYLRYSPMLYQDQEAFYQVYLQWLKNEVGIDLLQEKIAIAPFAHSCNGGIEIDEFAQSAVQGLFAVGEVSSCIEGANRLGGNSVGGALVFAKRAVQKIAENFAKKSPHFVPLNQQALTDYIAQWEKSLHNPTGDENLSASQVLHHLRKLMTKFANVYRTDQQLQQLLTELNGLEKQFCPLHYQAFQGIEIYAALKTAQLVVQSMIARTESRGAHYRADYPQRDKNAYLLQVSQIGIRKIISDYKSQ
ncbi:FAD-binding protein [Conservatibacter flavescens]|uniref:FAD-binding dehydrogenase n=1 Tax=Conservatibacter flavescens TaxID=28161 RepID=A0A2M8S3E3_9PAST|nr:FAD-binding protein [Conservatibacter flavescens]PJG85672.1 FAD-binding dehydrogenase [Conservatibacter flavescens]